MDLYAISELFDEVPMIRHKFSLIVNAMNDQGEKCSTKDEEILFKKSLHLINSQAEAMCKMLKIESCKCQQCLVPKSNRKRRGRHLSDTSGNTNKVKSAKKEISKDLTTRSMVKKSSHVLSDQLTKRITVVTKRTAVVDDKLELLRKKVKGNVHRSRAGKSSLYLVYLKMYLVSE